MVFPPQGTIIPKEDIRSAVWDSLVVTPPTGSYGERFGKLDKLITREEHAVGTLTADGTEQTIVEITGVLVRLAGYIDLANMAAGDTTVVRIYMMLKSGGAYRKYVEEEYKDAQTLPALFCVERVAKYGIKITLQQTAGVYRTYDYNMFKEVLA